jgi:predicted ATPase
MQITLRNIGVLQSATVNLTGLNVIAGPNGAGKSTVGKTIYTIIKAVSDRKDTLNNRQRELVNNIVKSSFFFIQNGITSIEDKKLLLENFNYQPFCAPLLQNFDNGEFAAAQQIIDERLNLVNSFATLDEKTKLAVRKSLGELRGVFKETSDIDSIKISLETMYIKIFEGQINNILSHETSSVEIDDLLKYSVSNNAEAMTFSERLKIESVSRDIDSRIWSNITFIESPLILQLERNTGPMPDYWTDLLRKIGIEENPLADIAPICKTIFDKITPLLGGELKWNGKARRFEFHPIDAKDDANLSVNNMSSGEKILGIFQRMAKLGLLKPENLLVLDEPENHLHPEWQVALAEVIARLSDAGIPILINSHSPDFIQALIIESEKNNLSNVGFYLANKTSGVIEDKTEASADILEQLSEPMNGVYKHILEKGND